MVYFVFINTEHNLLKDTYVKAINRKIVVNLQNRTVIFLQKFLQSHGSDSVLAIKTKIH